MSEERTPRIVTWWSEDAPVGCNWLARFWIVNGDTEKPRMEFHPVVIFADDKTAVIRKAKGWWADELAKAERRQAGLEKARANRTASQ